MLRFSVGALVGSALAGAWVAGCEPPPPKPLDARAIPTAVTSAQPLFISNFPEDGAQTQPAADAGSDSASGAPVSGELPAESRVRFDRFTSCPRGTCTPKLVVPDKVDEGRMPMDLTPDLGVAPPFAIWQQGLGPNAKLELRRTTGIDVLGVVLAGTATLAASENRRPMAIDPWDAFLAPGAGIVIEAEEHGAELVLIGMTDAGTMLDKLAALRADPKSARWAVRPGELVTDNLRARPEIVWAGGAARARLCFEKDRSPRASLGTLMLSSTMGMADHDHSSEWEVMLPIRAAGRLTVVAAGQDEGAPQSEVRVTAGTVVAVPPRVRHAWVPDGTEPFQAIQLYLPPGPEQRFKGLATWH